MTTYALIDHNSGYLWGVVDATTPAAAAAAIDAQTGDSGRSYVEHGARYRLNGASGYYVHRIDDVAAGHGMANLDGQEKATIAMLEAYPLVAVVEIIHA